MTRQQLRLGSLVVAVTTLVASAVTPALAAWSSSTVDTSWYVTKPSLRVDGGDHTQIAFQRVGDAPGIFFTTNASGPWVSSRVTSDNDFGPSLALDGSDHPHVAFARRSGTTGVYVTENLAGTWTAPTLVAADLDPVLPSLDLDASGHAGLAFASNYSFAPGIYYATNATGSWVKTRLSSSSFDATPWLRFDAVGHAHVLYTRHTPNDLGIFYATNSTGSWVTTRVASGAALFDSAQFEFDGAGKIQAAFRTIQGEQDHVYHATNKTGAWVVTRLPYDPFSTVGPPTLALNPSGEVEVFAAAYPEDPNNQGSLLHWVESAGTCCSASAETPTDGAGFDDYPSLGFRSDGMVQLAFRRVYPSSGVRLFASGAASSLIADSHLVNTGASIDLGPGGVRDVGYDIEDGAGGSTRFATGPGGSWALSTAGSGNPSRFATDIAADGSGKVRIADGPSSWSNATGPWTQDTTLPGGAEAEVEVDGSAHTHILSSERFVWYWGLGYQTDATGSWVADSPWPGVNLAGNPQASLALDAAGKPHIAFTYYQSDTVQTLQYMNRVSGSWTAAPGVTVASGSNAWPSIAVDAANKVHIAYIQYGSLPGIYYATNKTGSWVSTRITHSYSDGPPSLALDGAGHAYIATTRAGWAANAGIYVMTNATGSWAVSRVVATDLAGPVSLTVTSGGLARMVFDTLTAVVVYENNTATLAATTAEGPAFVDAYSWRLASDPDPGTDSASPGGNQPFGPSPTFAGDASAGSTSVQIRRPDGGPIQR